MPRLPLLILALVPAGALHALPDAPGLTAEGDAAAGHVTLSWASDAAPSDRYQLQESRSGDFSDAVTRYDGAHTSTVRSGLRDGVRFFRVRKWESPEGAQQAQQAQKAQKAKDDSAGWSAWSEPVRFEVKHHSLSLALGLCGVGAFVFLATAAVLLGSSRRSHD